MAGLTIKCPFCGGRCSIRTSERPSILTVKADIYCNNCGTLSADFVGQLVNVKRAVFIDCPEVSNWSKTEKEQINEDGKRPLSNAERVKQLKEGKQPDLFKGEPDPRDTSHYLQ